VRAARRFRLKDVVPSGRTPHNSPVKWHDGKPFTAEDVKCTFDLLTNQGKEKFRRNYRETWWVNGAKMTTNGEREATLHLKRPQPALLALLALGGHADLPCHVPPREMRQHPIGTGPFKFVDYKPNQYIKVARATRTTGSRGVPTSAGSSTR
jgi:peptide/nickel transport system substrate-binding protein